jgi:hypothetical protein
MNKLRPVVFLTALVAGFVLSGGSASGHEGEGRLEVVATEPAGDLTVRYRVRSVFVADGHGAPEATVTATVIDPQSPRTPVALSRSGEDGIYEGTVTFPAAGAWKVRFTSLRPTATLEIDAALTAAPSSTTTTPPSTTAPAPPGERAAGDPELEPATDNSGPPFVAIGVVLAVTAAALLIGARRRGHGHL